MNELIENSCQTYLGHTIQEMEDWQGIETLYYVDGTKMYDTLSGAKSYIKRIHYGF